VDSEPGEASRSKASWDLREEFSSVRLRISGDMLALLLMLLRGLGSRVVSSG
jgi:hypothetical protein